MPRPAKGLGLFDSPAYKNGVWLAVITQPGVRNISAGGVSQREPPDSDFVVSKPGGRHIDSRSEHHLKQIF